MAALRRISVAILVAVTVAACTGEDGGDPVAPSAAASASEDGVVSEDAGATEFVPGRFIYQYDSITAQATFRGSVATVNVRNGSGAELGPPGLYVIGADDRRYDARVEGAAPIGDGEQVTLEYTFPSEVSPATIGLAILSFGEDNVGAMAPMPRAA